MVKTNYKKLYKYCAEYLIGKKRTKENQIFDRLTKNLENKIKNAIIDEETYLILYDDNFNKNIKNILPKLRKHVAPFKITYRPKTLEEMTFIENICDPIPHILIIDWIDFAFVLSENRLQTLFNKYINYKNTSETIKDDCLLLENDIFINHIHDCDNIDSDNSDNSDSSFEMMK